MTLFLPEDGLSELHHLIDLMVLEVNCFQEILLEIGCPLEYAVRLFYRFEKRHVLVFI